LIKQIKHKSQKKEIENPSSFWDRLENFLWKRIKIVPWSKFSYIKIILNNGDSIILTSLMTNYINIQFENIETEYVSFPWIK
jgi:hypothetical protein